MATMLRTEYKWNGDEVWEVNKSGSREIIRKLLQYPAERW